MRAILAECVDQLGPDMSVRAACALTGMSRSWWYRTRRTGADSGNADNAYRKNGMKVRDGGVQPSALTPAERDQIIAYATSAEFVDKAPAQMFHALLERGIYLGSARTIYRVLADHRMVGDRRPHTTHPPRVVPHLHATGPCQVMSWDITSLATVRKRVYFYAYVGVDLYSRFMPEAHVHPTQSEHLATEFITACIAGYGGHTPEVIHSDNGAPMISGTLATLFADLGITRSFSRPRVSNDNPYSEALFKTAKYAPAYPDAFETVVEAQAWFDDFRGYYNHAHYHSGLNFYTPASVHNGTWPVIQKIRQQTLDAAYQARPDRFARRPVVKPPPAEAWINKPTHHNQEAPTP